MKGFLFLLHIFFMVFSISIAASPPRHWHETKGFGTAIKGGIEGEVYKVTNLKSSGPGSLKDAVSKSNRLVVFEVGGVITGGFSVASNVTIAGQTAPYPGITTIRGNVSVTGSNIVISHITHCLGSKVGGHPDAWNQSGKNAVLDHIAVYWGKDETLALKNSRDVTLYKCIIGEGLQFTGHEDSEHSKGLHIQTGNDNLSVIGCLCAHNAIRNPRVDISNVVLANHVVYNFGPAWDHIGPQPKSDKDLPNCEQCFNKIVSAFEGNVSLVGSVALQGPESKAEYFLDSHINGLNKLRTPVKGYLKDNIIKDRQGNDLKQANTEGVFTGGKKGIVNVVDSPPIWPDGLEPLPAKEALYEVLRTVGPHPGNRNPLNARHVKTVADGNGAIIDSESEVGGYPNYASTSRKLENIPSGAAARQAWLDSLEDEIAVDRKIDLSRLYSIVGSKASDRLGHQTSANQKIDLQKKNLDIKLVQRINQNKIIYASFNLSTPNQVSIKLFNLAGNEVAYLPGKLFPAGFNEIAVNVEHLSAGLYIWRFQISNTLINLNYNCF